MAEIKKEEAMFHDAIKGFLGKREQGLVMGHFRAVLSANAGKVPDGFVLVPIRPTDAMRKAGERERISHVGNINPATTYAAMIAAAPTQQAIDAGRQG